MALASDVLDISLDDRIAIAEVDYIIHHMNEIYLNKIPQKVRDYITILKKRNIEIYVDPKIPLEKQGLKEFTLYFLMILNLKYWCNDQRKNDILAIMEENQKKYDEKIKSVNDIFDQAEKIHTTAETEEEVNINKPREVVVVNPKKTSETNENIENARRKRRNRNFRRRRNN